MAALSPEEDQQKWLNRTGKVCFLPSIFFYLSNDLGNNGCYAHLTWSGYFEKLSCKPPPQIRSPLFLSVERRAFVCLATRGSTVFRLRGIFHKQKAKVARKTGLRWRPLESRDRLYFFEEHQPETRT